EQNFDATDTGPGAFATESRGITIHRGPYSVQQIGNTPADPNRGQFQQQAAGRAAMMRQLADQAARAQAGNDPAAIARSMAAQDALNRGGFAGYQEHAGREQANQLAVRKAQAEASQAELMATPEMQALLSERAVRENNPATMDAYRQRYAQMNPGQAMPQQPAAIGAVQAQRNMQPGGQFAFIDGIVNPKNPDGTPVTRPPAAQVVHDLERAGAFDTPGSPLYQTAIQALRQAYTQEELNDEANADVNPNTWGFFHSQYGWPWLNRQLASAGLVAGDWRKRVAGQPRLKQILREMGIGVGAPTGRIGVSSR
ncbi:MAG: hypothetical protein IRY99_26810, partial [Isosphaeraceae bacterium]|nr:hypothetical protein [Isosphaeraceae bacterium]